MADPIDTTIKAEWTNADALDLQPTCNKLATDSISRQAAIKAIRDFYEEYIVYDNGKSLEEVIKDLPSAQPTLYGYNLELLSLIASVMAKKGISPEEAVDIFTDIRSVYQMVVDEQKEIIRKAVEECQI